MDQPRPRFDAPGPPRLADPADGLGRRLERWAADARVDEAALARARERWLRLQADEESTLAGLLADLLEAAAPVTVHTRSGGRHAGTVRAVGSDFVALATGAGPGSGGEVVVALAAVASVRGGPGARAVAGDRTVGVRLRLVDLVIELAAEREHVRVVTTGGDAVTGVLQSVGRDVAVVRGTGDPPSMAYLPLEAIAEIVVPS